MWDDKVRNLAQEGFRRRPQSPLRGARMRPPRREDGYGPATERPPYHGVGTELKAKRESQGRDLDEVSGILHIQPRYLTAIEEGRFDDLPGSAYATGFMRAYGQFLGADARQVVERFRQESTLPHGPTKLVSPQASAEARRPRMTVVLVSLLAAAVLYAGWNMLSEGSGDENAAVEPAPERLATLLEGGAAGAQPRVEPVPRRLAEAASAVSAPKAEPAPRAASAAAREAQRDADATAAGGVPAAQLPPLPKLAAPKPAPAAEPAEDLPPTAPTLSTVELPREAASPAPPPPRPTAEADQAPALPPLPPSADGSAYVPQRFGGAGDTRVVVKATADSWVQIQAGRNETLLTRILRPGDTFHAPDRAGLRLTTGNVGGLEISVDGEPLGPLGPPGVVRRDISLEPEKLLAMNQVQGERR